MALALEFGLRLVQDGLEYILALAQCFGDLNDHFVDVTDMVWIVSEYEGMWRLSYGDEGACFVPVCEKCGRFVKADGTVSFNGLGELKDCPNATCKKCGRTQMIFEGYI